MALWPCDLERSLLTSSSSGFLVHKWAGGVAPASWCRREGQAHPRASTLWASTKGGALGARVQGGAGCHRPSLPSWELWSPLDHRPQRGHSGTHSGIAHCPAGRFPGASAKRPWPRAAQTARLGGHNFGVRVPGRCCPCSFFLNHSFWSRDNLGGSLTRQSNCSGFECGLRQFTKVSAAVLPGERCGAPPGLREAEGAGQGPACPFLPCPDVRPWDGVLSVGGTWIRGCPGGCRPRVDGHCAFIRHPLRLGNCPGTERWVRPRPARREV